MKTKLISNQVIAFLTLFLLLCIGCSCSFKTASHVDNAARPSPAVTPEKQSEQAANQSPLPPPTGFVNDFANVFDSESKARLESALTELKQKSDIEFAVVTIETTGAQPIFDYSLALAKAWGVGPKDATKGGGILLLLATRDRNWRIQVSRSLEKDLPDDVTKKLGDESVDSYRKGNFSVGIIKYVRAIVERLEGIRKFKLNSEITSSRQTTH